MSDENASHVVSFCTTPRASKHEARVIAYSAGVCWSALPATDYNLLQPHLVSCRATKLKLRTPIRMLSMVQQMSKERIHSRIQVTVLASMIIPTMQAAVTK